MTLRRLSILSGSLFLGLFFAGAAKYEGLGEIPLSSSPSAAFTGYLEKGDIAGAHRMIETLLKDPEDRVFKDATQGLISTSGWALAIEGAGREKMLSAIPREIEEAASVAFGALVADVTSSPEEFHKLACRYPLTKTAGQAWMEAGDRSLPLADPYSAAAYYQLAKNAGATLNQKRAGDFETAKAIVGGVRTDVVFDAAWWQKPGWFSKAKYLPAGMGNVFYVAGGRQVLAIKEGSQLWRWNAIDASSKASLDREAGTGRGAAFEPAILGTAGGAQVVVARQVRPGMKDQCLRAIKGTDGTLLWTTESSGSADSLSMVSNPTIAGRFVYATAVDFTANSARLVLVALDVTDGSLVFKASLGTLSGISKRREETKDFEGIWDQAAPLASGDCVFVTPNVGMAFAVDRFTGSIRFAKAYISPRAVETMPLESNRAMRFRNTPFVDNGVMVISPQDAPWTLGLSTKTGEILWQKQVENAHTLIGGNSGVAVFAGEAIAGVEVKSGKTIWSISGEGLSGPPVIVEDQIVCPRADGKTASYSIATGQVARAKDFRDFRGPIASPAVKKILDDGLMLQSLGR